MLEFCQKRQPVPASEILRKQKTLLLKGSYKYHSNTATKSSIVFPPVTSLMSLSMILNVSLVSALDKDYKKRVTES